MTNSVQLKDIESGEVFPCAPGKSLLVAMELAGKRIVPVGCRGGGCGRCRIRVLEGDFESKKMSRKHISEAEEQAGEVLACRIYPSNDLIFQVLADELPTRLPARDKRGQ